MSIVDTLILRIQSKTSGFSALQSDLHRVDSKLSALTHKFNQSGAAGTRAMRQVSAETQHAIRSTNILSSSVTRLFGVYALMRAGRFVFDTIREFETLDAVLATVAGPNGNVAAIVTQLRNFARETPSSFQEVENTFIRLHQMGARTDTEALRGIGNVGAAFRVDIDTMSRAIGKATIGNARELATALRSTVKVHGEMVELMIGGQQQIINRHELVDYFIALGNQSAETGGFAGAMERQMLTLSGAIEKLGDTVRFLIADVAKDKGFRTALTKFVNKLADVTKGGKSTAEIIAVGLSRVINVITDMLPLMSTLLSFWSAWITVLGDVLAPLTDSEEALQGIADVLKVIATLIFLPILAVEDFLTFMRGGHSVIGGMLGDSGDDGRNAVNNGKQWLIDQVEDVIGTIEGALETLLGPLGNVDGGVFNVTQRFKDLKEIISNLKEDGNWILSMPQALLAAVGINLSAEDQYTAARERLSRAQEAQRLDPSAMNAALVATANQEMLDMENAYIAQRAQRAGQTAGLAAGAHGPPERQLQGQGWLARQMLTFNLGEYLRGNTEIGQRQGGAQGPVPDFPRYVPGRREANTPDALGPLARGMMGSGPSAPAWWDILARDDRGMVAGGLETQSSPWGNMGTRQPSNIHVNSPITVNAGAVTATADELARRIAERVQQVIGAALRANPTPDL